MATFSKNGITEIENEYVETRFAKKNGAQHHPYYLLITTLHSTQT